MAAVRFHMNDIKADLGGGSDTITINFEEHDPIAIPNHSHNMADGTSTTLNYGGVLFHASESAEFSEKADLHISGPSASGYIGIGGEGKSVTYQVR